MTPSAKTSSYAQMYMIPPDIYKKVLDSMDDTTTNSLRQMLSDSNLLSAYTTGTSSTSIDPSLPGPGKFHPSMQSSHASTQNTVTVSDSPLKEMSSKDGKPATEMKDRSEEMTGASSFDGFVESSPIVGPSKEVKVGNQTIPPTGDTSAEESPKPAPKLEKSAAILSASKLNNSKVTKKKNLSKKMEERRLAKSIKSTTKPSYTSTPKKKNGSEPRKITSRQKFEMMCKLCNTFVFTHPKAYEMHMQQKHGKSVKDSPPPAYRTRGRIMVGTTNPYTKKRVEAAQQKLWQ